MDEQMDRQRHREDKLAIELKKQLDIIESKFKEQEIENSKKIKQKQELEKALAKEQYNSAALGSNLDQCFKNLKSSTEREHEMLEKIKHLEQMQTQLVTKVNLGTSLYRPASDDEYSPLSDNDYAHSEEDFKEEEEDQDSLQRAWNHASDYSESEDEEEQQAPGILKQNSNPATLQIIPGIGGCMITCKKCGMRSASTQDVVTHECTPAQVPPPNDARTFNPKETPPPRRARSYRPKESPHQRSYKHSYRCLSMGGVYL